jgi:hypothetical protein
VADIDGLYKLAQKPDLFNGFNKTYQSKDDEGDKLPSEGKRVQFNTTTLMQSVGHSMSELITITARKDYTNCVAKADVVVDGKVIIKGAPVSFLLFIEKQLTDLRTFVGKLPLLDESEDWKLDSNSGLYKTEATQTHRTKKIQKPIVLYPATEQHPAQTGMITEDVIDGFWTAVKHSGAMPKPDRQKLFDRVDLLLQAVKQARESANMEDEIDCGKPADAIFGFLMNAEG